MSGRYVIALALVAACGGDDGVMSGPDAFVREDAGAWDAAPADCDFTEADDVGNDTAGEATGLTAGDEPATICGAFSAREPDAEGHVDVDQYAVTVGTAGGFLIRVDSADGRDVALITAEAALAAGGTASDRGRGLWVGNHLVFFTVLEADEVVVTVSAYDEETPAAAIDYTITIAPVDAAARCAPGAEPVAYAEAADGTDSRDNDVLEVVYSPEFTIAETAATDDAPEPAATSATITAGMQYRLTGTSADVTTVGDEYLDRDTYLVATGASTNELTVRVSWAGGGADLDFLLVPVPAGGAAPISLLDGTALSMSGPELRTGAVLPSTSYWLWVGAYDEVGVTLPKPYVISLCGESY